MEQRRAADLSRARGRCWEMAKYYDSEIAKDAVDSAKEAKLKVVELQKKLELACKPQETMKEGTMQRRLAFCQEAVKKAEEHAAKMEDTVHDYQMQFEK